MSQRSARRVGRLRVDPRSGLAPLTLPSTAPPAGIQLDDPPFEEDRRAETETIQRSPDFIRPKMHAYNGASSSGSANRGRYGPSCDSDQRCWFVLLAGSPRLEKASQETFRKYADPLARSAIGLFWRLNEILRSERRGAYLLSNTGKSKFAEYKRLSTTYRFCELLGWIRAYQRELSFLKADGSERMKEITSAVVEVEKSLADGTNVEAKRLKGILKLWGLENSIGESDHERLSVLIDNELGIIRHRHGDSNLTYLGPEQKLEICKSVADLVCVNAKLNGISISVLQETQERVVQSLSFREAWLYRDWQSGVGDLMIKEVASGSRKFDVVGYKEFEGIYLAGSEEDKKWISRVAAITDNMDASGGDIYDARVEQLNALSAALSKLMRALASYDEELQMLLAGTLERASQVHPSAMISAQAVSAVTEASTVRPALVSRV